MKTAYELAMERLGGEDKSLTDEQKAALAEIDRVYEAKIAEVRLALGPKVDAAEDEEKRKELEEELRREVSRLETEREAKKTAVRETKE